MRFGQTVADRPSILWWLLILRDLRGSPELNKIYHSRSILKLNDFFNTFFGQKQPLTFLKIAQHSPKS